MYEETTTNVTNLLKNVTFVTVTTDCWTSISIQSYMAVTIHYIDTTFSIKSVLLECSEFEQDHTSKNLASALRQTMQTWGFENKILICVTDNAANITKAVREELQWKHFGCYAHTINLIAESALTVVDCLIQKVRNIVSHFKKSTKSTLK